MRLKSILVSPIRLALRATEKLRESGRRVYFHAALAAQVHHPFPVSVVVLGRARVYGSRNVTFGKNSLLFPDLHFETQGSASITLGDGVVLSRGVHLVAMAGIQVGEGTMIGEYASLRDANHARLLGVSMRNSGHTSRPIVLGKEVWVGRGVTILGGVTIGDHATIGANAVVTRNVPAGAVVGGVPAVPLRRRGH